MSELNAGLDALEASTAPPCEACGGKRSRFVSEPVYCSCSLAGKALLGRLDRIAVALERLVGLVENEMKENA